MKDEVLRPSSGTPDPPSGRTPSVSVIIPTFNGERTILATLASLARQDFPAVDWLIVDDASSDKTVWTAQEFLREHPGRGRVMVHSSNLGLSRTLNHGLRETQGELVIVLHQDVELVGIDWVSRAVRRLLTDEDIAVVTGYYGRPAPDDLNFTKKAFGVIRQQFHFAEGRMPEFVTFTEFKADLFRRSAVDRLGGFPEQFRIVGEDIWVSFQLRRLGFRLLKDYSLEAIQRFSGEAETLTGNFVKSFRFGQAMGLVLTQFGLFPTKGTRRSSYSRSRSWHRASQPVVALVGLSLLIVYLVTRNPWVAGGLAAWIGGRYVYYVLRFHRDLRRLSTNGYQAILDDLATGLMGLGSDVTYSLGLLVGTIRSRTSQVV
ncbi:MAG: glycosyltransferase family 2 protein [Thermoplasmata archaeon]|nr:glycosyltransferase family 2 protein [Thermoplasmata archaeon]